MKFLLDQSTDARLSAYLRKLGHDVTRIAADYPAGLLDPKILPFIPGPDPRYIYFSSQVKEAMAKCEFMARDRIGPIYMYGPVGSGKISLVRTLHEKFSQDERYNVKLLISPNCS